MIEMVLGKRVVAIIVMALMSTASPAVYQKVLQPTIDGLNCNISISDLVLDQKLTYAKNNTVFFQAYLSIQNLADVDVVLSPLSLDVYHYSEKDGRYRLIGHFNTSESIRIEAGQTLTSRAGGIGQQAVALLVLDENADEAIAQLIKKRSVELTLKGVATVGPITFQYEKKLSLNTNFFDPNFIIVDVFNYYPESGFDKFPVYDQIAKTTDTNILIVRAKFRNPSGIPMTLSQWKFDLLGENGKIATGIPINDLVYAYDPDFIDNKTGSRRNLLSSYFPQDPITQKIPISVSTDPSDKNVWHDILLGFNFTDPLFWDAPDSAMAGTKGNMTWFLNQLFLNPVIEGLKLQGTCSLLIGKQNSRGKYGIEVDLGSANSKEPQLYIESVKFHQLSFENPQSLMDRLTVGEMSVAGVNIDRSTNVVDLDIDANLTFSNPYRLSFNITNLFTDYYHVLGNSTDASDWTSLAKSPTSTGSSSILTINRANMTHPEQNINTNDIYTWNAMTTGITSIPHKLKLNYDTDDYSADGITKVFNDIGINPLTLNFTDPFWLLGPSGFYVDPTKMIEYLIKNKIDPLMLLKEVRTSKVNYYGDNAYTPLKASSFGELGSTKSGDPWNPINPSYDFLTRDGERNDGQKYWTAIKLINSWYDYGELRDNPQYEIVRRDRFNGWSNKWSNHEGTKNFLVGLITDNFPDTIVDWSASPQIDWLPPSNLVAWRIYASDNDPFWGYEYDYEEQQRNWYIVHGASSNDVLFRQNFTLDISKLHSLEEVDKASLSISFRYPSGGNLPAGYYEPKNGRFGIGVFNGASDFEYEGDGTTNHYLWSSLYPSYQCYVEGDGYSEAQNWKHRTVDVTNTVKKGLYNYIIQYRTYLNGYATYLADRVTWLTGCDPIPPDPVSDPALYEEWLLKEADYLAKKDIYDAKHAEWLVTYDPNTNDSLYDLDYFKEYLDIKKTYTDAWLAYLNWLPGGAPSWVDNPTYKKYLQMEVSFSCIGSMTNYPSMYTYFDDCILNIEYHKPADKVLFRLKDFFNYLESQNPEKANAMTILDNINFDPVKMMAFIDADLGIQPNPEGPSGVGANFNNYYTGTDTKLNNIIALLQDFDKTNLIDAGQPLSFLEMLNSTRYVLNPKGPKVSTPYGYRNINQNDGWVIEDPYTWSRAFVRALKDDVFRNEFGEQIDGYLEPFRGDELWMMLDNLGISLPWIIVYLYMHGWSKDDIFDLFEALGFNRQVKTRFTSNIQSGGGYPTSYIRQKCTIWSDLAIHVSIWLVSFDLTGGITPTPTYFTVDLGGNPGLDDDPISEDYLKLYDYLCEGGQRVLMNIGRPLTTTNTEVLHGSGSVSGLNYDEWISVRLESYELKVQLAGVQGSWITPRPHTNNPYITWGTPYGGLNDLGTQTLTNYLRMNINFNGAPLVKLPGDPFGLFTFLDRYFFYDQLTPEQYVDDYSSYTLLNYFNCKASDFVDIITDYDPITKTHDPSANGLCDDWKPLGSDYNYHFTSESIFPNIDGDPLRSWGTDVINDRLFFNGSNTAFYPYNGKIIWTDSPRFLEEGFNGIIVDPRVQDPRGGAPPAVSLVDMFAWFSKCGLVDSQTLFKWLEGKLPESEYMIQDPLSNPGIILPLSMYDHGIGPQKTWSMLINGTFNSTGFINWLSNVQNVNPYKMFNQLNNWPTITAGTGSPDPMAILYYMQNPNMVQFGDGATGWIYHPGIGGFDNAKSKELFWKFFNASWWSGVGMSDWAGIWDTTDPWNTLPGRMFSYLYSLELEQRNAGKVGSDVSFNFFQTLINLGVMPEDWINQLQNYNQKPFELMAIYDVMNYTKLLETARTMEKKTKITINGSFRVTLFNFNLYDFNHDIKLNYVITPRDYTAKDNLANFFVPSRYYTTAGTFTMG